MKYREITEGCFYEHRDGTIIKFMSFMRNNPIQFDNNGDCITLKPIPLTEEWLIKFGFEAEDNAGWSQYKIHDTGEIVYWAKFWGSNFTDKGFYGVDVQILDHSTGESLHWIDLLTKDEDGFKHVHTLQNLYFALTNEELTIKD